MKNITIKEAIEKADTLDRLLSLKESINREIDGRIEEMKLKESVERIKYPTFGTLKEVFESVSPLLFTSREGRKLMNRYISAVKENASLKAYCSLNEGIFRPASEDTAENYRKFLGEAFSSNKGVLNPKALAKGCKKIRAIVDEALLMTGTNPENIDMVSEGYKINNCIDTILEEKGTSLNSMMKKAKAIEEISEFMVKRAAVMKEKRERLSRVTEEVTGVGETSEGVERFNEAKERCISTINERLEKGMDDEQTRDRLQGIVSILEKKTFHKDTLEDDMVHFKEFEGIFD